MAKRRSPAITPASAVTITLKQAMVAAAIILAAGGAYGSIVWTQSLQSDDIRTIKTKLESSAKLSSDKAQEEVGARNKIREDFMANQQKMTEVLGKLDTRLAVAEANQKATNDQLGKIVDLLQRAAPPGR